MTSRADQVRILTAEAVRDAFRRKVVTSIVVVTLLSLWLVEGCTSCVPTEFELNGELVSVASYVGIAGMVIFGLIASWTLVLAGLLASDHITQPLDDGSAALVLSKPVGRSTFALTRLAGSLIVSLLTGLVLLVAALVFIGYRQGLPPGPGIAATLAALGGMTFVAAFAMTMSLYFNRIATILLVLALVGAVAATNIAGVVGMTLSVAFQSLNLYGPPLIVSVVVSLAPWADQAVEPGLALNVYLRHLVWIVVMVGALVLSFRRIEIAT